ncbi:MAG: pseudouridine synthase, partial [Gammaproteobacteria bacterium]|nr:pseudouridine synthase [Gammaproteobacteria bacterium]
QPTETDGRIVQPLARSKRNPLRRTVDREGKRAVTEWVKEEFMAKRYALLRVAPETGRTHQIRVHLHWLGFPIVGDALYAFKRQRSPQGVKRQMLHAEKLTLGLPSGKRKTFTAELPEDFTNVLQFIHREAVSG